MADTVCFSELGSDHLRSPRETAKRAVNAVNHHGGSGARAAIGIDQVARQRRWR
jgi:hypothetical protein